MDGVSELGRFFDQLDLAVGDFLNEFVAILQLKFAGALFQLAFPVEALELVAKIHLRGLVAFRFSFRGHVPRITWDF